jgi:putative phage-type endonuclease
MMQLMTDEQSRKEFVERRKNSLGGSDVAAVLGISRYHTPLDIYNDKLGLVEPKEMTQAMTAGVMLEDTVAKWYMVETGYRVIKDNQQRHHKTIPFLTANLDRVILPVAGHQGRGILEIKTAGIYAAKGWDSEPPLEYVLQLQHYFDVTGYNWGEFAVLIGGQEFRRYYQERDQTLIDMKNEILSKFWHEHVLAQVPPEPVNVSDIKNYITAQQGKTIEAVEANLSTIEQLREIKLQIKGLEAQEDELSQRIKLLMNDAEVLTFNGETLATFKQSKGSTMLDSKALKEAHPDLWAKFSKEKAAARTFLIK